MKSKTIRSLWAVPFLGLLLGMGYDNPHTGFLAGSMGSFESDFVEPNRYERSREKITTSLDPDSIKIMTWNTREGNRFHLFKNWWGDRDAWEKDYLKLAYGNDIVLLQEIYLDKEMLGALALIADQKKLEWFSAISYRYRRDRVATGVLTLTGVEASRALCFRVTEPLLRTPKATLFTWYPLKGRDDLLLVVNVHGIVMGRGSYEEQLARIKQKIQSHQGPLLLAGDFNAYTNKRAQVLSEWLADLHLNSVFNSLEREVTHFNFNEKPFDHIFYRGLRLKNEAVIPPVETSDHNPVLAEFFIPR